MNLKEHLKKTFPTLTDEQQLEIRKLASHAFLAGYSYRLNSASEENHATALDKYKAADYKLYPNIPTEE